MSISILPLFLSRRTISRLPLALAGLLLTRLTLQAAESPTFYRDDYWGYGFDHHQLPSADLLADNETKIFSGIIVNTKEERSGIVISQRHFKEADSEAIFDKMAALMALEGQKLMGKKQTLVIGGKPAVSATFVSGDASNRELVIMAATKVGPGERSWWFHAYARTNPTKLGGYMGVLRSTIASFTALNEDQRPAPAENLHILPGRFQVKTAGFTSLDTALKFEGSERMIEDTLANGGGRIATVLVTAEPLGKNRTESLKDFRASAAEQKQTILEVAETQVSGRDAARIKARDATGNSSVESLWVWDADLLWKATFTYDAQKLKSDIILQQLRDSVGSFTLLRPKRG
jgi:hypothetical protein